MDLQDQRIACLRMAIEMGCKTDSVVSTAAELMNFITGGVAPTVPAIASATEEANAERIAACGTEVPMTETADLALAVAVAAPSVASEEGMPESAPATDTVTEVAPAAVEPTTPVSAAATEDAAAPQEPAAPVATASEAVPAEGAPVAATTLVEFAPATTEAVQTPTAAVVEAAPAEAAPVADFRRNSAICCGGSCRGSRC